MLVQKIGNIGYTVDNQVLKWQHNWQQLATLLPLLVRVNDNVDLVLALPLAHLWVYKAGGVPHSPGMVRQMRLRYPGAMTSSDESRRRPGAEPSVNRRSVVSVKFSKLVIMATR